MPNSSHGSSHWGSPWQILLAHWSEHVPSLHWFLFFLLFVMQQKFCSRFKKCTPCISALLPGAALPPLPVNKASASSPPSFRNSTGVSPARPSGLRLVYFPHCDPTRSLWMMWNGGRITNKSVLKDTRLRPWSYHHAGTRISSTHWLHIALVVRVL